MRVPVTRELGAPPATDRRYELSVSFLMVADEFSETDEISASIAALVDVEICFFTVVVGPARRFSRLRLLDCSARADGE
jgi:hypothetical protein